EKTSEINAGNTALYGEMLERIVILENRAVDFYLKCVPFGFRIEYRVERYNKLAKYEVFVNSFAVIS
ncbi:MAG: recombinase family protein, partial [Oscillospiraceae bacterium]|nr:recombinase family protein [Oscillospiraceae bacterium]